jgi:uncharacterized membrane protein YesL
MVAVIEVIQAAFRDLWSDVWTVLVCNLLWLLSIVLIVPGPPATLALFYFCNRLAHGEVVDLGDFLRAVRQNWGLGWRWGLVNLLLFAILLGDIMLTGEFSQSPLARFTQGFYLAALAVWLLLQLYALPFLFEQEQPALRSAWRNGALMLGRNPGFSVFLGVLVVIIL